VFALITVSVMLGVYSDRPVTGHVLSRRALLGVEAVVLHLLSLQHTARSSDSPWGLLGRQDGGVHGAAVR